MWQILFKISIGQISVLNYIFRQLYSQCGECSDSINALFVHLPKARGLASTDIAKAGKKIFGCDTFFDHAAKQNQSQYPWVQNIVVLGLLKKIKGRWACLPLIHRFYHLKKNIEHRKPEIKFQTKLEQAVHMITEIADAFPRERILVATDSWFGNDSLYRPLRQKLGQRFHLLSLLRSNNNVFDLLPVVHTQKGAGRPRKYGKKLGNAASLAAEYKYLAK